jgi:SAM-dependent methyltransferase
MSTDHAPFDRATVRRHRDRAARAGGDSDFLFVEVAERLADRLADINRSFPVAFELGSRSGHLQRGLDGRGGIETLVQSDLSAAMLRGAAGYRVVADEEVLPFAENAFDLAMSNLALHWVNDLPGTLIQINRCLKPDGVFLATLFGTDTLAELRQAFLEAEAELEGGVSPRVSPFIDVRDAGGLLQRAGFALPVADSETVTVTYDDPLKLMRDLHAMGESNALADRRRSFTRPATLARTAAAYHDRYADTNGRVPATFQIVTLTGWAPAEGQPKPLRPGSARTRLADALDTVERPLTGSRDHE